ncbi:MAG: hypothetical protein KGJ02_06345 [Verrucomicrobiota bacterium]|nr:hypothetical protein [Verrucomicrobiota bacterium]
MSTFPALPGYNPNAAIYNPNVPAYDNGSYQARLARQKAFIDTHKISERYQGHLETLCKYRVDMLVDDSSSMNERPRLSDKSEWEKMGETARIVAEVGTIYDEEGIDVTFLNRPGLQHVHDPNTLYPSFFDKAHGVTPSAVRLSELLEKCRHRDRKSIIVFTTDGHPTNANGEIEPGKRLFEEVLNKREKDPILRDKVAISFVMCTNDEDIVKYYDKFTDRYSNVTITENYAAEKKEMREKFQWPAYTEGDWIVKIVLGAVVKEIGEVDQPGKCFCTIL